MARQPKANYLTLETQLIQRAADRAAADHGHSSVDGTLRAHTRAVEWALWKLHTFGRDIPADCFAHFEECHTVAVFHVVREVRTPPTGRGKRVTSSTFCMETEVLQVSLPPHARPGP